MFGQPQLYLNFESFKPKYFVLFQTLYARHICIYMKVLYCRTSSKLNASTIILDDTAL